MKKHSSRVVACTAVLCILCVGSAYGASNSNKVKITGLITGRDGENLMVKTTPGQTNVVVVLTDTTTVAIPKGLLGRRKTEQAVTALIPGLRIQVQGTGNDTRVVAKSILQRRFASGRDHSGRLDTDPAGGRDQPAEHSRQ